MLRVCDVEFNKDEIFNLNKKFMCEHRLRVYRKDSNKAEPLSDTHQPQDLDTDSEIESVIVIGDENGLRDDRIKEIDSDEDSDCSNEPEDYSTSQSLNEQANVSQNSNILSE
jgi:hypothetical protein